MDYINILKEYEHAPVDESGPIYMYDEKENEEFINELLTTKEKKEMFKNKISIPRMEFMVQGNKNRWRKK